MWIGTDRDFISEFSLVYNDPIVADNINISDIKSHVAPLPQEHPSTSQIPLSLATFTMHAFNTSLQPPAMEW